MRTTLKNRIVSAVIAGCLVMTTLMSPVTAFSEENTEIAAPFGVATVGDAEKTVYALNSDDTDSAVSVYSSEEDSVIEVNPVEVNTSEEGLEILESYVFTDKTSEPSPKEIEEADETDIVNDKYVTTAEIAGEDLWVTAGSTEAISLESGERVALYNVEGNEIADIIVEDISTLEKPVEVNDESTGVALVKDTGYRHLNLVLYPENTSESAGDNSVTLDGMMPTNALARVIDVTADFSLNNAESIYTDPYDRATSTDATALAEDEKTGIEEKNIEATSTDAASETKNQSGTDDAYISGRTVAAYDITIKDGRAEYQPDEERPIYVEISDERISADMGLQLWHIKDDGTKEQLSDFTVEEGKVSFRAVGFSIYEIVEGINENNIEFGWLKADTIEKIKKYGADGFYISNGTSGLYLTGDKVSGVSGNNDRDGLVATTTYSEPVPDEAVKFYFEPVEGTDDSFYVYKKDGENKTYLKMTAVKGNNARAGITFADGEADKSVFKITEKSGKLYISSVVNNTTYYWNRNNKTPGFGAIVGFNNFSDTNVYILTLNHCIEEMHNDPYNLDGVTYGLINYTDGSTTGTALMADAKDENTLVSLLLKVKGNTVDHNGVLYVSDDTDISMWTFTCVENDIYTLSTMVGGNIKYLKMTSNGLGLSDTEPTEFRVVTRDGKIKLVADNKAVSLEGSGFKTAKDENQDKLYLNPVRISNLSEEDFVTYAAQKVDMSKVPDGTSVIVYTRIWDDDKKTYNFYAVDHDGTLYPCYERGNNIMWIGSQINTLLWDFTEYTYDDGTPNNYFELQNQYSEKYLAPQIGGGQVLADKPIGINLPERASGNYYSPILAWDDPYYSFAGLKASADDNRIESCPKIDADTFYFAVMHPIVPTLTTVETIDNTEYGIKMKMVDFTDVAKQNAALGSDNIFRKKEATPGILSTDIGTDGYPTTLANKSLKELFSKAEDVNHLFIASTYNASGYFEYDSCQNFASLKGKTGGDFTVYKEIGTMNSRGDVTDKHGQFMPYNDIEAGVYSTRNPLNLNDVHGNPLPESDPRKYEQLHLVGNANNTDATNWNFGMELEASFVQTPSGKDAWGHDIIFEFTGDDDFWLYVDGELIIDLGGIHSALPGNVNFSTGEVNVNGKKTTLKQLFEDNYKARNPEATTEEINTFLDKHFKNGREVFEDYTSHTMHIFYMERGKGASNLHMRFNLSYVTSGHVIFSKEVTGSEDLDFNLVQYPYQIWYKDEKLGQEHLLTSTDNLINVTYQNSTQQVEYAASYSPPGSTETYQSVYFLYPGKIAEIHFPADTIEYKIVECGINKEVYNSVKVNDTEITGVELGGDSNRATYDSGWLSVSERPRVTYENHVNAANLRTLKFQKKIYDENGKVIEAKDDPTLFNFRLYLSNGVTNDLNLANMTNYYVINPSGLICTWNSDAQQFEPTIYDDYSEVPSDIRDSVTFNTSMNGSISKIPPWYTVGVPNLPVGIRFKVVENFTETPIGYGRVEYEREAGSYYPDPEGPNVGTIRENESPKMNVVNKRGVGLQANKVWSDKNYTKFHETIYTAIYVDGMEGPLEGSVRRLKHPDTYVRYFIERLLPGKTIEDYHIYEVELSNSNPDVDDDGIVTNYGTITKINGGEEISLEATARSTGITDEYDYVVSYEEGTPQKSLPTIENPNTRVDTITNTRNNGVVMTLYDMQTREVLAGGTFTLKRYDSESETYVNEGTFKSGNDGRINILYDFLVDTEYVLTETASPKGYIGPEHSVSFMLDDSDNITLTTDNSSEWQEGDKYSSENVEKLTAYINIYNRPYTLQVYKSDKDSSVDVPDAHFTLYRGRVGGKGGVVKDYYPMPGYEDMETDSDGLIPDIGNNLPAGIYFLTESKAPEGYEGIDGDIKFEISALGGLNILDSPVNSDVKLVPYDGTGTYIYTLNVPNKRLDSTDATLKITKTVDGSFGNRAKEFNFTFEVTGDDGTGSTEYIWKKNGVLQDVALKSGGSFTLGHGDSVDITVPKDTEVTITEDSDGYVTTFKYNNELEATSPGNAKTVMVESDSTLAVTNTRDGVVPTGVESNISLLITLFGVFLSLVIIFMWRLNCRRKRRLRDE